MCEVLELYSVLNWECDFRQHNGPVIVASPAGGTDIENVAHKTPELIGTYPIDIFEGLSQEKAEEIGRFLKFEGTLLRKVFVLYSCFNSILF